MKFKLYIRPEVHLYLRLKRFVFIRQERVQGKTNRMQWHMRSRTIMDKV